MISTFENIWVFEISNVLQYLIIHIYLSTNEEKTQKFNNDKSTLRHYERNSQSKMPMNTYQNENVL